MKQIVVLICIYRFKWARSNSPSESKLPFTNVNVIEIKALSEYCPIPPIHCD